MFDRHQAEITIMQFTGHSLPVHQSMSVSWTFTFSHFCQPNPPSRFLSITGHWNVSLPSGASLWNGMFGRAEGQYITPAAVVSILLYGCTTWTLIKRLEKKLDSNYTRMLRAILNKSLRQHPTKHQLYGRLPPITKTIQIRRTRHAGQCWRSRDELISDVLLWIPTYGRAKVGRPARTYIQQLCEDTGYSPEDQPEAINDREKW